MKNIFKIGLMLTPFWVAPWCNASLTNPCTAQTNNNARYACEALYKLNALVCEKVTNLDFKLDCILKVKNKQRQLALKSEDHYQTR